MYLDNLTEELLANDIKSEIVTTIKNGIERHGLKISGTDKNICPVIYPSADTPVMTVVSIAREALEAKVDIPIEQLQAWSYVRDHIRLDIQRRSDENLIKKELLNLDLIMRVHIDIPEHGQASVKVTRNYADMLGAQDEELWRLAYKNSEHHYRVRSLLDVIGIDDSGTAPMYVVTTADLTSGAAALAFPNFFLGFCQEHHEEGCYILPSSTQEVIVLTKSGYNGDTHELAEMVKTINADIVDPTIQLDPVVYQYRMDTDRIEIVAEA